MANYCTSVATVRQRNSLILNRQHLVLKPQYYDLCNSDLNSNQSTQYATLIYKRKESLENEMATIGL